MADPRTSQNAARLSEDIGDVLSAIRRMIADDDALATAQNRVRAECSNLVQDDAGAFLARRYGGDAALARQMVEQTGRPALTVLPTAAPSTMPAIQGDTAIVARSALRHGIASAVDIASPRHAENGIAAAEAPKVSGWRAWLRSEPREAVAPEAGPHSVPSSFDSDMMDDADDFAEAFDWKARMRPALEDSAAVGAVRTVESRLSGWASPPVSERIDQVAQLAAEADAFDADLQVQAALVDEAQGIRDLVREVVREELNGELGQKFSANLRAVIRREVTAAIEAQIDRF